ncbi:oligosaccharide flippase family protein, partial [Pseudothermotoga sp.]|uniref:lipopolysaccharide biosynthesis protein n=1 Tax=Pseudothermotoga sp. TaxID=2033661 RepID=UPI0031F717BC
VINTTVSLLVPILSFHIVEAIFRFAVECRVQQKSRNVLSSALFFCSFTFFLSLFLYPVMKNISIFVDYSVYFYIIFFLTILNGIFKQYVRGLEKVKLYVASDIFHSIVFALSNVILLTVFKLGIKAYLLSNIISLLCTTLFIFLVAKLYKYISPKVDIQLLKEMLSYSIPLIPNGIMWWIVNVSDRYIITYFINYEATGIYSVAARFPSLLTVFFGIFLQAWQLSAMEEYGRENYGEFFRDIFGVISSTMFLGSSLLFLIIKPFMKIYVGQAYSESWKYVPFLFLGAVFSSFSSFYGVNYTASKKTIGAFSTSVIAAGVKIITIVLLIKFLGIQAASISTFSAYFSMWIARIFHTKKLVNVKLDKNHLFISSILVLGQAILLLMPNDKLYLIQTPLVLAVLFTQRKYFKQTFKFAKELLNSR